MLRPKYNQNLTLLQRRVPAGILSISETKLDNRFPDGQIFVLTDIASLVELTVTVMEKIWFYMLQKNFHENVCPQREEEMVAMLFLEYK